VLLPTSSLTALSEKMFTVGEVSAVLRRSTDWVRREFRSYPGVIRSGGHRPGKRPYFTLVMPQSVLDRWIREHSVPPRIELAKIAGVQRISPATHVVNGRTP
jgi:hypothetical protein